MQRLSFPSIRQIHPDSSDSDYLRATNDDEGAFVEADGSRAPPRETVSSCHPSVSTRRFYVYAVYVSFSGTEGQPRARSNAREACQRQREISEGRLTGIFILLVENAGMDAPQMDAARRDGFSLPA